MVIQALLVLCVLALLVLFVRSREGAHLQAGKRVALVLFALVNVYAVLRPEDITAVAHLVGVGRGTDLLLYALVVAFFFGVINFYLRFRHVDRRLTELARALAVREAEIVNRDRELLTRLTADLPPAGPADEPARVREPNRA